MGFRIFILVLPFFLFPAFSYAAPATDLLGEIPVQQGGRIKPFETFAQEAVMYVTGKSSYKKIKATELVWHWMVEPEIWNQEPLISVTHPDLVRELGVKLVNKRISPQLVLEHESLIESVRNSFQKKETKEKLTLTEQKRIEIYEKARLFREIGQGSSPGWVPRPENPEAGWLSFKEIVQPEGATQIQTFYPERETMDWMASLRVLFEALKQDFTSPATTEKASNFRNSLDHLLDSRAVSFNETVLSYEKIYNRLKPFHWAWQLYALAFLFFLIQNVSRLFSKALPAFFGLGFLVFMAGIALHTYGFFLRCVIAGRPPVSNMYESIIWVSWAAAVFAAILFIFYRSTVLLLASSIVSVIALVVAQSFPALVDPFISPLVPVLRNNMWLTIHVLTITLSYGAFALAWGVGHGALLNFAFSSEKTKDQEALVLYLYRAMQIGVVLLAAGTVLGGVWANYSWGRFWGWDPKETWALIALLGYIAVLHGRFSGWLDPFGFTVGSVIAFLGVLMAWYGVNYVLAAGLHSYGFGGGGAGWVLTGAVFDLLFIGFTVWKVRSRKSTLSATYK